MLGVRSGGEYLYSQGCDVLSLVYVVVQAGGQGQEAVGGDEEFLHHVSIERKWEEWLDTLSSYHCVGQPCTAKWLRASTFLGNCLFVMRSWRAAREMLKVTSIMTPHCASLSPTHKCLLSSSSLPQSLIQTCRKLLASFSNIFFIKWSIKLSVKER